MTGAVSAVVFFLIWGLAAMLANDPITLPGPFKVIVLAIEEAASGDLFYHLGATLLRTIAAFVIAMTIGSAIGIALGRNRLMGLWGGPWLVGFLNLPALVTIVLCYIWIGLTEVAAITAVALNKIPLVATQMREGAKALDPKLDDMSKIFGFSMVGRLRHIILPQLGPHFAASARTGVSLIWKIVLVVELLGRSNGVGFMIHQYFQLFDVARVLVYALSFVIVMLLVEALILEPWERHATRWRQTNEG